ncbi:MAG: 3-phosphoserine/phosphohydroxythreonine transaminase [Bacteroidia bacterium]|jgi:phosphoserine aminotransferase|nr:3-phosphoserine/phosphohydroxythreonine transaminase [Bacteroidota bacterium]MBP6512545.1 3-phosphoserine/phosphohydroxythreonine transaminase [Bacteroidia bacterium]MBP7244150.1 3-phosphoserine/phosphohydroxythreonine transaminase [Bacteroidia bacterium]
MRKHNLGAGPGVLPESALQKSAAAALDFNNIGMSILEISHRSKDFEQVLENTTSLVKELLGVPDNYSILFLQGGASTQFAMVPMNLLHTKAAYIDTGVWANKAIKEAKLFGDINVVASSKDQNYSFIPKDYTIPTDCDYLHITSNNTIYGTQMSAFPNSPIPLICDMSSDIFSRPIDVSKFDLIYAGAQKNMGPAGVTLVIIKNDILKEVKRVVPTMMRYATHIEGGSMYNTPPVFSIYVCMATLEWLKSIGGVAAIEKINKQKAELFYNEVDTNPLFKGTCAVEDRSRMNACFLLNNPALDEEFMKQAKAQGIVGIKGHRSVGGFRASMYNALPLESVKALTDLMKDFALKTA